MNARAHLDCEERGVCWAQTKNDHNQGKQEASHCCVIRHQLGMTALAPEAAGIVLVQDLHRITVRFQSCQNVLARVVACIQVPHVGFIRRLPHFLFVIAKIIPCVSTHTQVKRHRPGDGEGEADPWIGRSRHGCRPSSTRLAHHVHSLVPNRQQVVDGQHDLKAYVQLDG
jgi:hypothetical protein